MGQGDRSREARINKENEDFETHVVLPKAFHTPDPNIPRIGEIGIVKRVLTKIKKAVRKSVISNKKNNRKVVDTYEGDDDYLDYLEEFEYSEYNHPTEVVA